jgi:6-phosphofructokinase 1
MGKRAFIIVVAEGGSTGGAFPLAKKVSSLVNIEHRVTVLGHIQRGGTPTARDRVLASRLGVAAVNAFLDGQSGVMVGEIGRQITYTPLEDTWTHVKAPPIEDLRLSELLST